MTVAIRGDLTLLAATLNKLLKGGSPSVSRWGFGISARFHSVGAAGTHTQMGWEVTDVAATVAALRSRGVVFEEYDLPGLKTRVGIASIHGNYPSEGSGEYGAWFKDSEGNLLGIGSADSVTRTGSRASIAVYLERGAKRTFAGALDWPGWCRQGSNENDALAALFAYGPKYASILAGTRLGFTVPKDLTQLVVVERLPGTATTDFGAPGVAPTVDHDRSCNVADLKRFEKILSAGWRAFDQAVKSARGKTLATGPRGGGRSLDAIVTHVIGADAGYLTAVGWKAPTAAKAAEQLRVTREAILVALKASAIGEIPSQGPRGGTRWTARYFVRRVAWHVMAHVWEIERRAA